MATIHNSQSFQCCTSWETSWTTKVSLYAKKYYDMTLSTAATSCFADTCCSLLPRTQDQGFPVSLPSFPFYGIIILLFKSINKAIAIAIAGRNVQDLLWNHVFLDLLESILQLWFCFQLSAKNRKCRPIFNIQCHRYFHPNQQLHCNALPYRGLQMFFRFRNFQFSPWPEELKLVRCVKGRHGYWICVTMPTPTNTTHQRANCALDNSLAGLNRHAMGKVYLNHAHQAQ